MKIVVSLVVALLSLLLLRFFFFFQNQPQLVSGQQILLSALLQEEPELSNRGQRFVVKNDLNQRFYINTDLFERYHYGDSIAIEGKLQVKKYDNGQQILSLNFPKMQLKNELSNPLIEASRWIRQKSTALFNQTLPPISASLLLGIVFGAKGDFSDAFPQNLQSAGVLDVIAASGMNVSFFTGAVLFSLGRVFVRRISLILSIFAVIFYSFLVGFEPSILRASVMAILVFSASFFGRQAFATFVLFLAATLMLLWQPNFLFDVGFQLSVMATLGILLLKPLFEKLPRLGLIQEDLTTTLAAQIATLPILLGTFRTIGLLSVLVNILVLWTVPILMMLGSLAVLSGLFIPLVGQGLLLLSLPFLLFFQYVISFFGSLDLNLELTTFLWQFGVAYYFFIAVVIWMLRKKPN